MPELDTDLQKFANIIASAPGISAVSQEAALSPVNTSGNFDRDASLYQPPAQEQAFKPSGPGLSPMV